MPVTSSASWGAQALAKVFTSEGVLGFAGCAMACASGAFALYMTMQGPGTGKADSHDFTVFAQMTPRARAERAARVDAARPATPVSDEIDPIVTGSIPSRLKESAVVTGRRQTADATMASDNAVLTNVVLRQIDGDSALIEMQDNLVVFKIGQTIPGAGRLMAMTQQDGRPALQTSRGLIVEAR